MANPQNPPVEIQNTSESSFIPSSTRDDNNLILTRNVLPALETRLQRFVLPAERRATISERARSPLVRFSVSEMIGFLEDAAIQVATRADSQYLQSLRTTRSPSGGSWDFSNDLRLLGGTVTIDGVVRAQRMSGDARDDLISRGVTISETSPVYTLEGSDLHVYGGTLDNPDTATIDVITRPAPVFVTATGTYTSGTNVFTITSGGPLDADLHTLVDAVITDTSGGPAIRGILTDINEGSQNVRLDIDGTGFGNSGTITMTWKTPGYSMMSEFLEEAVVELAAADMFAAMGEVNAVTSALETFESQMKTYGLRFFKI